MWELALTDEFERRRKRYTKDHPRELQAVLDNLDTYFKALLAGVKPLQNTHGFTHNEPLGAVAIDQKGGGKSLAQARLYVFPESETEKLYLITLGDKRSQKADIETCRSFITELRKEREASSGDEKAV